MLDMFKQFEFSVGSFAKDGCTEWFHDFLDGDRRACELILGGTTGDLDLDVYAN